MTDIIKVEKWYPAIGNGVLYLFCSYVLIWFLQLGLRIEWLGNIRIELIVALILTAAVITIRSSEKGKDQEKSDLRLPVVLLFISMVVQIPFSHSPDLSAYIFWNRVFKFAFMALFIMTFVKGPRQLNYFVGAFLLACFYITQESFRGALDGSMVWENQGVPRLHGSTEIFSHPNSLAGVAIGALPFLIYLFPVVRSKFVKLFFIALAVTSLGCVLYSGSRTAYLGVLGFVLFMWWHSQKRLKFFIIAAALFMSAVPFIPEAYKARFETIFTGQEIEGQSIETRKQILEDAVDIFLEHPLGVGVAAFSAVRREMFGRSQDTHNMYLEAATNLGVQGLTIFLFFIYKMMRGCVILKRSFEEQKAALEMKFVPELLLDSDSRPLAVQTQKHIHDLDYMRAVCLAMLGYIFIRLILGFFGSDLYEIYWWIGLGLCISLFNINRVAKKVTAELLTTLENSGSTPEQAVPA